MTLKSSKGVSAPSHLAAKRCKEWIDFLHAEGWAKESIPALVDLWWKYHDHQTGEVVHSEPGGSDV